VNVKKLKMMEEVKPEMDERRCLKLLIVLFRNQKSLHNPQLIQWLFIPRGVKLITQAFNAHQCHTRA
jgi:hypothetical protein